MGNWIIIPDIIVERIKQVCRENIKAEATPEQVLNELSNYFECTLEKKDQELFKKYKGLIDIISSDTIKRALNGRKDGGVSINKNVGLLDILCWYAFDKNWKNTLSYFNISESEIKIRASVIKESDTTIEFDLKYVKLIDKAFWDEHIIFDEEEKKRKLFRFFTHTDSRLAPYVIANGEIVGTENSFIVTDTDGYKEEKTIGQILDFARSKSFSLIKIVGDGGAGKSTFLLSLAYSYFETHVFVLIEHIAKETFTPLIDEVKQILSQSTMPVVLLIDNAANASIAQFLSVLIEKLQAAITKTELIFIVAERTNRFASQFEDEEIEQLFSGNVQTIEQIPFDVLALFEKIYSWFIKIYPQLNDEDIKQTCQGVFTNTAIESISEKVFLLITHLQLNNNIVYEFDWDDWDEFINTHPLFSDLKNLYIAISCFYQFGIKVNISFKSSQLGNADRLQILRAINELGIEKSPILLQDDNQYLSLKHEHLANWYCRDKRNANLVQGFFRDFLMEIHDKISAKLIRKIRKVSLSSEFKKSCIASDFTPSIYLEIIKEYLEKYAPDIEEKVKMLNERGIAFWALGNQQAAIESFEKAIQLDSKSNHARDQLARIYLTDTATYQLALNQYFEIYRHDGVYAKIEIYKLLKKCTENNVILSYPLEELLSVAETNTLARKSLVKKEFLFAEEILSKINLPDLETAECYNLLAHCLVYANENIERKRNCFRKAIQIKKSLGIGDNYAYEIDFAIFLYRIREFTNSSQYIKNICEGKPEEIQHNITEQYENKIRSITKLFLANIPPREDESALYKFLSAQCKNAAALISHKQKNVNNVIKGAVLLQTVRFHSKYSFPEIYYRTLIQLAYCHMQHADKKWNNLSKEENMLVAENYFDWVYRETNYLTQRDYMDMIKNLLSFKEERKSKKALTILENILSIRKNKYVPTFYRYRGIAKWYLKNFQGSMADYKTAIDHSKDYRYKKKKDYNNDMAYTYNNMAFLICDAIENNYVSADFTLEKAEEYCNEVEKHKKDFAPLPLTRERIKNLRKNLPLDT